MIIHFTGATQAVLEKERPAIISNLKPSFKELKKVGRGVRHVYDVPAEQVLPLLPELFAFAHELQDRDPIARLSGVAVEKDANRIEEAVG